jgi:hypothetical protein
MKNSWKKSRVSLWQIILLMVFIGVPGMYGLSKLLSSSEVALPVFWGVIIVVGISTWLPWTRNLLRNKM